jgi:hypothetical protein
MRLPGSGWLGDLDDRSDFFQEMVHACFGRLDQERPAVCAYLWSKKSTSLLKMRDGRLLVPEFYPTLPQALVHQRVHFVVQDLFCAA